MIGIVAVSHSEALAAATIDLARQMLHGSEVPIRAAAGAGTDDAGNAILGTDATRVADAIDALAELGCDGVLVLMDLGSALMSAELGLELHLSEVQTQLAAAPFVEGMVAASVAAAGGASLSEVAAEAASSLVPKLQQLGVELDAPEKKQPEPTPTDDGGARALVTLVDPAGFHARPASSVARAAAKTKATITLVRTGDSVPAASMIQLLTLGAKRGDEIEVHVPGEGGRAVLDQIVSILTTAPDGAE